jgi:hypothetical protein
MKALQVFTSPNDVMFQHNSVFSNTAVRSSKLAKAIILRKKDRRIILK